MHEMKGESRVELRVLHYFLTVAKVGNITRAAEALHITQPTLSRQLMELEEELGIQLLDRGKRQVTLTDAGILLQQRAKQILALTEKTERDLENLTDMVGGGIAIGCVETNASWLLPKALKAFFERYPMVQYELYSADGDDIREKLDRSMLDIAILVEPVEVAKYDFFRLPYTDIWGVLMRLDDPLAERQTVQIQDLTDQPLILPRRLLVQSELESWLGMNQTDVRILGTNNLLNNAALLVKAGLARVITLDGAVRIQSNPETRFVPLMPQHVSGHVMAWRKNQILSSAASKFIEFVKMLYEHDTE